jgi:Zn-finger nucleic acid-binding protein
MDFPNKHSKLEKALFHNTELDYCPLCLGVWFDKDELRLAKDNKDQQINWLDFDIWRDKKRFEISRASRQCPVCRVIFVQVRYEDSKIKVDFCRNCQGIWLDRGEFKRIMVYLRRKSDYEILRRYTQNAVKELWEVFTGPEKFREELEDFLMLLKLFNYKFVVQHQWLNKLIENAQK